MVRCVTITFVLSGVVLAGLCYFFYSPLPPHLANKWQLQFHNVKIKASFIYSGIQYGFGLSDRLTALRNAFEYTFDAPISEGDETLLEIYDTQLNGVSVRVYKPKSAKGPLPGLVYYHGGGWVYLNVSTYDGVCAHIARIANIIVISVEYRLAPEFPFPAGFDDCVQVARFALLNGGDIGLDPRRIAVGGDSAGGNLAAAVSMKLRDDKVKPALKAQLVIYGVLQLCDFTLPSFKRREPYVPHEMIMFADIIGSYFNLTEIQRDLLTGNKYLTPEMQKKCDKSVDYKLLPADLMENHVRPDRQAKSGTDDVKHLNSFIADPRACPLMAENLAKLPSSFVLVADWDMLRDENFIYAERLKLAGNKVTVLFLEDSFHGILNVFDYERCGFDAGPKAMNEILSFIKTELA